MRRTSLVTALGLLLIPTMVIAAPRKALDKNIPQLKLDGVTFSDSIDFLRDVSGMNVHVNWKALELVGVEKSAVVNLRLSSVSMRKALTLLIAEVAPDNTVTFYVDEGIVEVTTKEIADKAMITRVYNVQDLLLEVPDFTQSQNIQLQSGGGGGHTLGGSGGGGGGSSQGIGQSLFGQGQNDQTNIRTRENRADDLIKLIEDTIQPEIWKDNGGPAAIRMFNGHLIVTAPRSVHEALAGPIE